MSKKMYTLNVIKNVTRMLRKEKEETKRMWNGGLTQQAVPAKVTLNCYLKSEHQLVGQTVPLVRVFVHSLPHLFIKF